MSIGSKMQKKLGKSMTKRKKELKEVEPIFETMSNENLRGSKSKISVEKTIVVKKSKKIFQAHHVKALEKQL